RRLPQGIPHGDELHHDAVHDRAVEEGGRPVRADDRRLSLASGEKVEPLAPVGRGWHFLLPHYLVATNARRNWWSMSSMAWSSPGLRLPLVFSFRTSIMSMRYLA